MARFSSFTLLLGALWGLWHDLPVTTCSTANGEELILTKDQRSRHLYVTGSTGSGKSKFLEYLIRQDILNWRKSGE